MAVLARRFATKPLIADPGAVHLLYYVADTHAERPSSSLTPGDQCFVVETGVLWVATGATTWSQASGESGPGGGPHAVEHENGGDDEISVAGLSGELAEPQTPKSHTHAISDTTGLQTALDGKAAAAVVTDHVALADPHTQYQRESEKAAANGYASLDANTLVPAAQLPACARMMCVPMWPGTNTLTNMLLADTELPATHWRQKLDLTGFTQFRLTFRVATVGTAGSDLRVQYSTDDSSFSNLDGSNGPEVVLGNSTGHKDSGWVNLAAGAIGADRYLRIMGKDGDGAADPVVRQLTLWLR